MTPMSAKNTNVIEMLAALKRRFRNTLTSSIGWSVWRSQAMNAAMIAAPAAKAARMIGLLQPRSGASIRAQTTALRPAMDRPVPGRSILVELASRELGTSTIAPIRHAATTGRLIRKMLLQAKLLDQEAAGDRSDRDADSRHRGPCGDRLRSLVGREDVGQDRQGGGHDPGRAEAHEGA